jgi:hypothetical protein
MGNVRTSQEWRVPTNIFCNGEARIISFVFLLIRYFKQYKTVALCRKDAIMGFLFYCCQHERFHVE